MSVIWPAKDPAATEDYDLDWTNALGSDTIAGSSWALDPGVTTLTISSPSFVSPITKIWLAGGTPNQTYTLTNTVTTSGGDTLVQRVSIRIKKQ